MSIRIEARTVLLLSPTTGQRSTYSTQRSTYSTHAIAIAIAISTQQEEEK
jgi:hypothetical protein